MEGGREGGREGERESREQAPVIQPVPQAALLADAAAPPGSTAQGGGAR